MELGGLVVKAGIVELTADDRATVYGATLWIAAKLQSPEASVRGAYGRRRESRRSMRGARTQR
ncbi:conjugal transfer protein TraD [Mesorhizobium sp. M0491]|uniref:conjugal transfer protein TraD n=1 Tax=Mesorhizobium sp. M0491 TaxID=2956950 RepID=UPI0033396F41